MESLGCQIMSTITSYRIIAQVQIESLDNIFLGILTCLTAGLIFVLNKDKCAEVMMVFVNDIMTRTSSKMFNLSMLNSKLQKF